MNLRWMRFGRFFVVLFVSAVVVLGVNGEEDTVDQQKIKFADEELLALQHMFVSLSPSSASTSSSQLSFLLKNREATAAEAAAPYRLDARIGLSSLKLTDSNHNPIGNVPSSGNVKLDTAIDYCPPLCDCLGGYLECKKLGLKRVPQLPDWVEKLDLTRNKLDDDVENSIGNLTKLTELNLKKNHLQQIPVFKGLSSLRKLILGHNKIQVVTFEVLLSLPNLVELDLSRNIIQTILPNTYKNQLTSLNLNSNRLATLEENTFDHLKSLVELQINHNHLKSIPSGLFEPLTSLEKLDLSGNRLNISWSSFRGLDRLRTLKMRSNGFENLPDAVFHALKSISTIELDSNRLTSVYQALLVNLTTLTRLSLSNNSISRIDAAAWEYTQQLRTLDLSLNSLTELTQHNLDRLGKLKELNLRHNRIKRIAERTFSSTKNLEQLNLSENQLSGMFEETESPFAALKKLKKLDLSDNNIKSISQKAFIGLESIELLNLVTNNITSIQYNAFEPLPQLDKLLINSTHFLCDCNLHWLLSFLKQIRLAGQVSIICEYPTVLKGKQLLLLNENDFMCTGSPKPRLINDPPLTNRLIIKGEDVTFKCSAISSMRSNMTFMWRHNNTDIRPTETESHIMANNNTIASSSLHLNNVNHDHSGKYQCVVTNSFGTTYSPRFNITVATYPVFNKIPANLTLNSRSTARLDCSAYGEPMPQIAWQKDGGNDFPAARERRMHVMPDDDAFYIVNLKISDMGVYTCTAENPAGVIKANATLTVHEPPTFVKSMESKEVTTGQSSVLECMSSGSPKPTLRWLKDEKPIQVTERHFFAAEGQLLIIVDTMVSDAGTYKCEMENELGAESGNLTLKVNKAVSRTVVNVEEMTGIVIITVFCCAVGTSIIWVVIIYQTKKGNECNTNPNCNAGSGIGLGANSGLNYHNNGSGPGNTILRSIETSNNSVASNNHYLRSHPQHNDYTFHLLPQQQIHTHPSADNPIPPNQYHIDPTQPQPQVAVAQQQVRTGIQFEPTSIVSSEMESNKINDNSGSYNGSVIDINSATNLNMADEMDRISSKDSGTGDSAKRCHSLENLTDSYLHLNDGNYCQIDNFDQPSISYHSGINNMPYRNTSLSNLPTNNKKIDDPTRELSVPLIIDNDENYTNSIYMPQMLARMSD